MSDLANKKCEPCRVGGVPLQGEALEELAAELGHDWSVVDGHHLARTFTFADFADALAYVNRVGAMAEEQNHHPDLALSWGKVTVEVWTHKIGGLSESDFVFAAKAEALHGG